MTPRRRYILIGTLGYVIFATAWIYLSDQLLLTLTESTNITWLSTAKGLAFVAITAILLFLALHNVPPERDAISAVGGAPGSVGPVRLLAALAVPVIAFALQWTFWGFIQPYVWFLFFPAVFFSSWIGGLAGGVLATALSVALVWYVFIPPAYSFVLERPISMLSIGIFFGMGLLFSCTHQRLRRAEQQAGRAMFRGIVEQSLAGIYIIQDQRFRYVNQGFADIFGYTSPSDIIDRITVADLVAPQDRQRVADNIHHRINGKIKDARYTFTGVRADGTAISLEVHGRTLEYDGRSAVIGIVLDITERMRAEDALRQKAALQEQLSHIAASVPGMIYAFSLAPDGNVRLPYASPAIDNVFGIPGHTLLEDASPILARIHADDLGSFQDSIRQSAQELTPWHQEFRYQHPHKGLRWVEASSTPERVADGSIIWHGFAADISERKRMDERLHQAATVFETTHEGVMVTDADQHILMVNRAFCTISGYSEQEVIGSTPALISSGRQSRQFYQQMWATINTNGHWQGEIWNRRKSGEIYPELLSISAVKDSNGRTINYVGVFADISQLKDSEARLEHLAHHDPLTQLPNRLLFQSRLEQSISRTHRNHGRLALLMLDLDRFKDVNDSFGHIAGDELLQQVAIRLAGRLREIDTVARLGGDEFTVIMENIAAPEDAAHVANEIIASLSLPWSLTNDIAVHLGASVGISIYPDHGQTAKELLQHADTALYQAKASGRGRFHYFSEDLTRAARERLEVELGLQRALAHEELRVYYQPQVNIASGRVVGAEALVRWQHPTEGLMPPSRFIPVAEATGLIGQLGIWVLRETCRQGRRWIDAGLPRFTLAVNLSPRDFQQSGIEQTVANILAETGYPPQLLELELTESALMERDDDVVQMLNRLRALGVRLAIDDFGTGYSSLAYLMNFPLDVLKIDKRFIDDLPHHHDGKEIAATIITMGHSLGFKVLAEGVENDEQFIFLQQHGCDMYQGYLASRPMPAEDFASFVAQASTHTRIE